MAGEKTKSGGKIAGSVRQSSPPLQADDFAPERSAIRDAQSAGRNSKLGEIGASLEAPAARSGAHKAEPKTASKAADLAASGCAPPPASLKSVAAHLGLSTAAVSRVLSGSPAARSIPAATQQRILAAAELLNYHPNIFARSLRNRRSFTIGVMVPEVSEGYATLVLSGIEERLLQEGYFYFVISHHHRADLIQRYQHMLLARGVEGIVAVDTPVDRRLSVPIVTVSGHHECEGVTNIVLNHKRAAALAVEHLRGLGHKRIAFIKGQEFSSDTEARWQAIRHAAAQHGVALPPKLTVRLEGDSPTHEPGYFATQRLLAQGESFTALFAFNDTSAIGAVRALREAGLRVPQDVSVVGFDDVQSAAFQNPGLTTVRQPLQKMGVIAAQTILQQINAPAATLHAKHLVVDPEFVVRGSTCPPRSAR